MAETSRKHWFLGPSYENARYVSGGLQVFRRMFDLVTKTRPGELVSYRMRDQGVRYLDDISPAELNAGIVWVTWQPHVAELAERIPRDARVVLYAQAMDFGKRHGQETPAGWPLVCVSRFIAGDYSVKEPWRLILHLPPALHPGAVNTKQSRDIDVLIHRRKAVPYLTNRLVPALRDAGLRVELIEAFLPQEEFFARLNRSKTYLYWAHKLIANVGLFEGFGMQPLEAIACGAIPVSNFYGGLSDYLEAPHNCRKIGVHSLTYDVGQIQRTVTEYGGRNPDEERMRAHYGEETFAARFASIEHELEYYFSHCPAGPPEQFEMQPPPLPLFQRAHNAAYGAFWRNYRAIRGIRPN